MHADADQIGQVVLNLLVNAQQALAGAQRDAPGRRCRPASSRAARRASRASGCASSTTARASTEALRSRIFEPFFTTKPEGHGTGLGLAVSRSMARDHGGDLMLEPDRGDGDNRGGASFRLSLPISGVAEAESMPGALPMPARRCRRGCWSSTTRSSSPR